MVTELRKFKRETYILAQTEGQLDSSSVVGIGLPKSGANLFQKKKSVLFCKAFQSVFGMNLCVQCFIAETR